MHGFRLTTLMLVLLVIPLLSQAQSLSPREQLQQYVADLQKNPEDQALREKIIKLAATLRPPPSIPEEARRHTARGKAAFEAAKNPDDFGDVVREFRQASLSAPWWGPPYFDLGRALDQSGDYARAKQSLSLYLLTSPPAVDAEAAQSLIYEIEYRQEKAVKEAQERDARVAAETAKPPGVEGTWNLAAGHCPENDPGTQFSIARASGGAEPVVKLLSGWNPKLHIGVITQSITGNKVQFVYADPDHFWSGKYDLTLSNDGTMLIGRFDHYGKYPSSTNVTFCRQ
jgi:hypothetical protein